MNMAEPHPKKSLSLLYAILTSTLLFFYIAS